MFENYWESPRVIWESLRISVNHGEMNQWKILNNQLEPFKNHDNCWELARIIQENHLRIRIIDDQHELLRITEFMKGWESPRISENHSQFFQEWMRITENHLTIAKNQWESLIINQYCSRIMRITENCLRLKNY